MMQTHSVASAATPTQPYLLGRVAVSGVSRIPAPLVDSTRQVVRPIVDANVAATVGKAWRQDAVPMVATTSFSRNGALTVQDTLKPIPRSVSINSECSTIATEEEKDRSGALAKSAIIIFDWDDTLLPTTATKQSGSDFQFATALRRHARLVEEVLRGASAVAHVSIVTLSQRPWVDLSARRYFPNVDFTALFHELDISVHYASEHGPPLQLGAASLLECKVLKRNAMASCITDRISGVPLGSMRLSLLSIGDSLVEQQASKELVASWCKAGSLLGNTICKTMKFDDEPSLPQLDAQLRQLLPALPSLAQLQRCCDLTLQDATQKTSAPLQARQPAVSTVPVVFSPSPAPPTPTDNVPPSQRAPRRGCSSEKSLTPEQLEKLLAMTRG